MGVGSSSQQRKASTTPGMMNKMLEAYSGCRVMEYRPLVTRVPVRKPLRRLTSAAAYVQEPSNTSEIPIIRKVMGDAWVMMNRGYVA